MEPEINCENCIHYDQPTDDAPKCKLLTYYILGYDTCPYAKKKE